VGKGTAVVRQWKSTPDTSHVPNSVRALLRFAGPWVERFLSKVDFSGACWLWKASVDSSGYGTAGDKNCFVYLATGETRSSRVAHVLFVGPIPEGKQVLHHCDVRRCVCPEHFYLGDNNQNVQDRNRRGRTARNTGEKHGRSKLTWEQVREIRANYVPRRVSRNKLAEKYGVDKSQIDRILSNRGWKE
jgi:hypothetical protein